MDAARTESPIFTVADREFGWQEVTLAATVWGEWQSFFEQTRQRLACLRSAAKQGLLPVAAEMRDVTNAFRYAHNLISADDTGNWLARWQLTVEDWVNYLRGQLLQKRCTGQLSEIVAANPVTDEEVTGVIKSHAICADKLQDWAIKLAGRTAIAIDSGGLYADKRLTLQSAHDLLAHIESEFERKQQQIVTPKRIENQIADHWLDWIHFDCRYLWFPEKRIAREAAWCLSEDGLSLDEIANHARGIVQHWNFYLDEVAPVARSQFLAAHPGDWLGPLNMLEGFPLFSIIAKTMPTVTDPHIRRRAEQAIITSFTEQAINERVKWATGS